MKQRFIHFKKRMVPRYPSTPWSNAKKALLLCKEVQVLPATQPLENLKTLITQSLVAVGVIILTKNVMGVP